MADIVLSLFSLVEGTLSRVISLITDEIILVWGLHKDLGKLKDSLFMIRYMLQYAEEQQVAHEAVTRWLKEIKYVAYNAEDVLDEFDYESLRQKMEIRDQPETKVRNLFSKSSHYVKMIAFHRKMAHKVKTLNESLDEIQKKGVGLGLIRAVVPQVRQQPETNSVPDRDTDSVLDNSKVVGRERDVSRIVNLLTCCCDQQVLTVIPIVGIGGLGKTTLAKLIFKEAKEKKLFDETIWICVSDNFDNRKILKGMLESIDENTGGLENMDAILKHLERKLEGKKFFLMLDDVWNESREKLAVSGNNGNVVVLTTRKEGVASTAETSSFYRHTLTLLPNDECWSIIRERVFGNGGESVPSNLQAIGKEIAEKCRGVPLVAKVLGGTMCFNRDREAWLAIRNNSVLNTLESEDNILPILRLSFDRLPSYLKPCFAYCSIFPKDAFIEKKQLIQLWLAEGLFEPSGEDVGSKYFNALLLNSFFQDVERDIYDNIRGCKMHDLIHDLASSISGSETSTVKACSIGDIPHIRHLNIIGDGKSVPIFPEDGGKKLRSLFIRRAAIFHKSWKLKSLRTLKLEGANMEELPSSIGKLKHLRYLDVSSSRIKAFPESIIQLYNLRTLRFLQCHLLGKAPREMSNLISLRHIEFSYDHQMPAKMGLLTCLETLPLFVVGPDRGGEIQELECLNRLGGELTIKNLEEVMTKKEAEKANLQQKTGIKALQFVWGDKREGWNNDEEVLEGLLPHPNIECIEIENYLGDKLPSWLMMKFSSHGDCFSVFDNLVKLKLRGWVKCEEIPRLGNLPRLKILEINGMDKVRCIGNEFYNIDGQSRNTTGWRLFPALKVFTLSYMDSLVEWTAPAVDERVHAVTVFPCLQELSIMSCRQLKKIPITDRSSLVKLEISGCDELSYLFDELHSFPSLKSLTIFECMKLTSLPCALQSCLSLEELSISECLGLKSVQEDLGNLSSLVSLEISCCTSLSYFPERILCRLTKLKSLKIGCFSKELDNFPYLDSIQDLLSLEHLTIYGPASTHLPHQIQYLTALKSLYIGFFEVEALPNWLGNLASLRLLRISCCENLKYLPTATAMQRLSQLARLHICGCPLLKESCAQGSGSEWYKISHIPRIQIT